VKKEKLSDGNVKNILLKALLHETFHKKKRRVNHNLFFSKMRAKKTQGMMME